MLALDNLPVHYTHVVKECAAANNIRLLYLPPYSSEFNPIENLWAHAKRKFRKDLMNEYVWRSRTIQTMVLESINSVPWSTMRQVIDRKKQLMKEWLEVNSH